VSRIIVFDLNNNPVGAFEADCNRGWILLGNTGVSDGGQTTVSVSADIASQAWLQLGRLVLVERAPLPSWVGVIDTPWTATLPAQITLYNAEYLFSLRSAERSLTVSGPLSATVGQMIKLVNEQEETFIALGNTGNLQDSFDRVIEQSNIWDQLIKLLEDAGYEMIIRPARDIRNHLTLYIDVGVILGANTDFLLHDGPQGNMRVTGATVNGKIINRVKGVSGQSTEEAQLESDIAENQDSQNIYRTRSEIVQYQNVTQLSVINQYTKTYLDANALPYLDLTVDAYEETFAYLRVGNTLLVHAADVYLPGGRHGWKGYVRILAMVYDEQSNTVKMTLRGAL
jgi:hypothetical protein